MYSPFKIVSLFPHTNTKDTLSSVHALCLVLLHEEDDKSQLPLRPITQSGEREERRESRRSVEQKGENEKEGERRGGEKKGKW